MTESQAASQRRVGSQRPRIRLCPDYDHTFGPECGELADAYGMKPDPWEQDVLDCWLARDADGKPAAVTAGLSVPRQNGKNACIEMFELFCIAILGLKVLHSAHEIKTAHVAFVRLSDYFENGKHPELTALVKVIHHGVGQEDIILKNGGSIQYVARSRSAARGFTVDIIVADEAQEMTDEQSEALMSIIAAAPSGERQIIYTGTPTPPSSSGTVFERTRWKAINGELVPVIWHEWSVAEIGDVTDRSRWYATNPALGIRLSEEYTASECASMTPDGFARERLGWWVERGENSLLARSDWTACSIDEVPDMSGRKMAYGVKFATDGGLASLSVAAYDADNPSEVPHIELIDVRTGRDGTMWIADWLQDHRDKGSCVVIDGLYGRDVLVDSLNGNHMFPKKGIVTPSATDVATAASMLKERVDTHRLSWYSKQDRLSTSALGSEKRLIGNRGAWGFGGDDPTPIESCSLALWGVMTTKRNAGRKLRIG